MSDGEQTKSPLKALFDVRREELPLAGLMFSYFFLVITSFWILKPIKKTLFITHYDVDGFSLFSLEFSAAQAELIAKLLNLVVAFLAAWVFSTLSARHRRQALSFRFTLFFLLAYGLYAIRLQDPGELVIWSFYLFGDLFSTLMVATFFAFLNDSMTSDSAKRLYGPIGLGGVVGGVFGSTTVRALIDRVEPVGWMGVLGVIGLLILLVAWAAGRIVDREGRASEADAEPVKEAPKQVSKEQGPSIVEAARLVVSSRYLLSIVAIVGIYEVASSIMDFQFTATVSHFLAGPEIGRHFSTVYAITNTVSLVVQIFVTSFVMSRFGVGVALLVLPASALLASVGFVAIPMLWMGSLLNTADNGFSYSINQSAKESLYVPTTREEKYKAKAFIDMFVQRFAKSIAVVLSLIITSQFSDIGSIRLLSFVTIPLIGLWTYAAIRAGREFTERSEAQSDDSVA